MVINPRLAIKKGWVLIPEGVDMDKCIQPNAIDFTIDKVFTIDSQKPFYINESNKHMRGGPELIPSPVLDPMNEVHHYWKLDTGIYDGMSNFFVDIPEGVAALLIIRSTFNRNGLFITSGLYDSLFSGSVGFAIHNRSGAAFISPGTRIGQLIFIHSDSTGGYAGRYNTLPGQHWSEVCQTYL